MTCIANYKTKKAFKEAVANGRVVIEDPSIFAPFYGTLASYMETHSLCTVTNHPKRSWYASVTMDGAGRIKVD